jgi:hypothetical protein
MQEASTDFLAGVFDGMDGDDESVVHGRSSITQRTMFAVIRTQAGMTSFGSAADETAAPSPHNQRPYRLM